jgi:3-dehydroquinate dehydratase II
MKVLIIHGPNLNLLGKREPDVYGSRSLEDVNTFISTYFKKVQLEFFQSNHEGEIIDQIQKADGLYNGVVINPGAFTHYSYAIRDAVAAISIPVVEVHLSNVAAREEFRHKSVIAAVAMGSVIGMGAYGYVLAVQAIAHHSKRKK